MDALKNGESDQLPAALTAALGSRSAALERFARAAVVRDKCAEARSTAESALPDLRSQLQFAVNAVCVGEARARVELLESAESELIFLRYRIAALQLRGSSVPNEVISRVYAELPPVKPTGEDKRLWNDFMARLQTDPNAELS
jgi:hypothetical protein